MSHCHRQTVRFLVLMFNDSSTFKQLDSDVCRRAQSTTPGLPSSDRKRRRAANAASATSSRQVPAPFSVEHAGPANAEQPDGTPAAAAAAMVSHSPGRVAEKVRPTAPSAAAKPQLGKEVTAVADAATAHAVMASAVLRTPGPDAVAAAATAGAVAQVAKVLPVGSSAREERPGPSRPPEAGSEGGPVDGR